MTEIDVVVVGAGVTGLACAAELASRGVDVCVIERHPRAGMDTSTHNSGVVHAGIYYPEGSLKARLCVEGRELLYDYCEGRRVPATRTGKLIVASTEEEVGALETLHDRGRTNGVDDLDMVDARFVRGREPNVAAVAALWSPSTGIVSPEALVQSLLAVCADRDVAFLPSTSLVRGDLSGRPGELDTGRERIRTRLVVNAAGLFADAVSASLGGEVFEIYPCRGDTPSSRRRVDRWSTASSIRCLTSLAMVSAFTLRARWMTRSSSDPPHTTSRASPTTSRIGSRWKTSWSPHGNSCRTSGSLIFGSAEAASGRSCARRANHSRIS